MVNVDGSFGISLVATDITGVTANTKITMVNDSYEMEGYYLHNFWKYLSNFGTNPRIPKIERFFAVVYVVVLLWYDFLPLDSL